MTTIEVPENHSALILAEDGTITVLLPNYKSDDDPVSWKDALITAISARILDEKWTRAQLEWLEKQIDDERRRSRRKTGDTDAS